MIDAHALAAHILVAIAHARGRRVTTTQDIAGALGVRREDVRSVLTRLHREGHVDATNLRLTLSGLAIAAALDGCKLPSLRQAPARTVVAA
jgi:transcription initiation factor IIE alpha subunit